MRRSSAGGGSSAAAIRRAARSAMAARSGCRFVDPRRVQQRLLETQRGLAVRRHQRPPQLAGDGRDPPRQDDAAAPAGAGARGHLAHLQRAHHRVHQRRRPGRRQPCDGRHQDAAPGDVAGRRPCPKALLRRLEGPGQVAAGCERRTQGDDQGTRQRRAPPDSPSPPLGGGEGRGEEGAPNPVTLDHGPHAPLDHGPDIVSTQLATSPTSNKTPKMIA